MLNWKKGPKKSDGIWAKHWYQSVWNTTSFIAQKKNKTENLNSELLDLYNEAKIFYDKLYQYKIKV